MRWIIAVAVVSLALLSPASASSCRTTEWGCASKADKAYAKKVINDVFGREGRYAACIAFHESGFNRRASNMRDDFGGSHGLFQINGTHRTWVDFTRIYDVLYNVRTAKRLRDKGGWGHWTVAHRC